MEKAAPEDLKEYYAFVEDSVNRRIQVERQRESRKIAAERKDMFHFLCTARDPDTGDLAFNNAELNAEAHLLIIAGSDTTAHILNVVFFYICHFPRTLEKLVTEIRKTFSSADDIVQGPALLTDCTYLRASIDEAFRLAPAGPSELERTVLPGGANIAGEMFPEGVHLGVVHYAMQRNEAFWGADVNVFRPERWLIADSTSDGNSKEEVKRLKSGLHTFGKGVGNCIGQRVAMLQLSMAIARTLWRFDVRLLPGSRLGEGRAGLGWGKEDRNTFMIRDAYIALDEGPVLQFRERSK
jgi:cytochrome P450